MNNNLAHIADGLSRHVGKGVYAYIGSDVEFFEYTTVQSDVAGKMDGLRAMGVKPGMNVAISAANSYEWIVTDLATVSLDCCLVAIPEEVALSLEFMDQYALHLALVQKAGHEQMVVPGGCIAFIDAANPGGVRAREDVPASTGDGDAFSITFSSGTSGVPKAMRISRCGTENWIRFLVEQFGITRDDSILIFLPFSHLQQRMLLYVAAMVGMDFIVTRPERLFMALSRLSPSLLVAPPMFYESVETRARAFLPEDHSGDQRRMEIQTVLGGRARRLFTGFAPIRKETLEFYDQAGLPLYEGYGVTECGQVCLNTPAAYRLGSVGKPVDDADLRLADDGEVQVKKKYPLSLGYVGPVAEAGTATGEYHPTGDIGQFDEDGFLYIIGRTKEIIVTRGGYKVHPQVLEEELDKCPGVNKAVVFGTDLPSLVALVSLDTEVTSAAKEAIQAHVDELNKSAPSPRRIGKVVFTERTFDETSGLLTRSLKLNRAAVFDAFKAEIMGKWANQ